MQEISDERTDGRVRSGRELEKQEGATEKQLLRVVDTIRFVKRKESDLFSAAYVANLLREKQTKNLVYCKDFDFEKVLMQLK